MSRLGYRQAADFFVDAVARIGPDQWALEALDLWNVRDLVGHTSRALLIVEQFSKSHPVSVEIRNAVDYYRRAFVGEGINERIAERGKRTGQELGDDPARAVTELRDRVIARVDSLPDNHPLGTLIGGISLIDYLPGRTTELVVHTLDLANALHMHVQPPRQALSDTLHLLADLAIESGCGTKFALIATGRGLVEGRFSVIG
jgi:uncharacterized protein (TIGR03083 family)